jgi:hypothetical protein
MTRKQIAFIAAGVLSTAAATLYKCTDDSPVVPGIVKPPPAVDAGSP